jgi:HEAT repeat protein
VTRSGAEPERAAFVKAAARELEAPRPAPLQQFLIRLLQTAGRADAVPALARCLGDSAIAESARQALAAIPGPEAAAALRDALPRAAKPLRVGILHALGLRRDGAAVELALAEAASDDAAVRVAAVEALGWIADPRAEEPILRAVDKLESQARRLAVEAALRFAAGRLAAGDRAPAARVHERLLQLATEKGARSAALLGLARSGSVAQVAPVAAALEDPDVSLRHCALECLSILPGDDVTRALGDLAAKATGDVKLGLERVLARRGARA